MGEDASKPRLRPPRGLITHGGRADQDEFATFEWPVPTPLHSDVLTAAEQDVLALVLDGFSNLDIAARRGTSERTVANQVGSIFHKLAVHSRAELFSRSAGTDGGGDR